MTYLMVLVVRSEDPEVLVQLADLAHRDVVDARLAAKLLQQDERLDVLTDTNVFLQEGESSTVTAGRMVPSVTSVTTNDAGRPVVAFEQVRHDQLRIEASVDDDTGVVETFLAVDVRDTIHDGEGHVLPPGEELLERSFVVARDADPIAQILRADTLLVAVAASTESRPVIPPQLVADPLPAGIDHPRERRALIDELLFDRP